MAQTPRDRSSSRWSAWRSQGAQARAERALARQLQFQEAKAERARDQEADYVAAMRRHSGAVRALVEDVLPVAEHTRVVEVGSGAHGLIFYFGRGRPVGVDPLAAHYAVLFPSWQGRVPTIAASGNALPFPDGSFDVVLCDNVVDHADDPRGIVRELGRILAPGGVLYFTVNVHHAVYAVAAWLHATWTSVGVPIEIGPFADHTVHLTPSGARRLFRGLPLDLARERCDVAAARAQARAVPPRHLGDRLKRAFFKNAVYELVARREPPEPRG